LVASMEARVGREATADGIGSGDPPTAELSRKKRKGARGSEGDDLEAAPKLEKLLQQLGETELECVELHRKVGAWERLNRDSLAESGLADSSNGAFAPVMCTTCAPEVTVHLLLLAVHVIKLGADEVEKFMTREFVSTLFEERPNMTETLVKLKRIAIVAVATESDIGSKVVLDVLRSRLLGTKDQSSAEILGILLGKKFPLVQEYSKLAMEAMDLM
jgi:hypothetical protein